jgi:hypothetical protein
MTVVAVLVFFFPAIIYTNIYLRIIQIFYH